MWNKNSGVWNKNSSVWNKNSGVQMPKINGRFS